MTAKVMTEQAAKRYDAARHATQTFWQKADEVIERRIKAATTQNEHDPFIESLDASIQEWQTLAVKADQEATTIYNDPASWEIPPSAIQGLKERRAEILAAIKDEALSQAEANELISELAGIETELAYDFTTCPESDQLQAKLSRQWDQIREIPI